MRNVLREFFTKIRNVLQGLQQSRKVDCSSQEKQTQKMFFLFFFFQKWTLATLLTIIYFQKQTYSIFFTNLPFQKQTHLWNMPVYGASANSSFRLHSLILKSIYSSSFIQPLIDSLTGLSVGLPALDMELTITVSLISSLQATDAQTLP